MGAASLSVAAAPDDVAHRDDARDLAVVQYDEVAGAPDLRELAAGDPRAATSAGNIQIVHCVRCSRFPDVLDDVDA